MYPKKELLDSLTLTPPKPWNGDRFRARQNLKIDPNKRENRASIPIFDNFNRGRVAIFIDGRSLFYAALQ